MRKSSALLIALALAGSAWAQDGDTPKKQDPPTFEDLKKNLGEVEEKQSRDENEKRDAHIQKNQEDTLKIYSDTLNKKNGELQNVSRRLEINKALQVKYTRLLDGARNELALMKSQYINRTVALKKSVDDGKISKEAYEKLLEEDTKRFRNREKELVDDIAFYEEELRTAAAMAKDLAVKKELMEFDPFAGEKPDGPKGPRPGIAEKIKKTMAEMSGYRSKSVIDTLR